MDDKDIIAETGDKLNSSRSQYELEMKESCSNFIFQKLGNLKDYKGDGLQEKIDQLVKTEGVVMFSKTTCGFCNEAKSILQRSGVEKVIIIEVDQAKEGGRIHNAIQKYSGVKTVPVLYIQSELIGGCTDLKKLESTGELTSKLNGLVKRSINDSWEPTFDRPWSGKERAVAPFFCFPDTVNNNQIRVIGFQVFCISVVGAISEAYGEEHKYATHWVFVGLLCDFILRMLFGAFFSPLGAIAGLVTLPLKPDFRPGPPKQFACLCGVTFSTMIVAIWFGGNNAKGTNIAGSVVCAMLAGAAGMEAFLDFCAGCVMYGWFIKFGLLRGTVYKMHVNFKDEKQTFYDDNHKDSGFSTPDVKVLSEEEAFESLPMLEKNPSTIQYKVKDNDFWKEQFHFIKYCQVNYFMWPLSIATTAAVFRAAAVDNSQLISVHDGVWYAIGLVAAIIFVSLSLLYTLKAILYTKKVRKELYCPLRGPAFGAIPLTIQIFGFLLQKWSSTAAEVFIWAGVSTLFVLSLMAFAVALQRRLSFAHIQLTWMILPVGNVIGAFFLNNVNPDYSEAALALYGFSLLMYISLFAITLYKGIIDHNSDDRLRSNYFIWVAAPAAFALGTFSLFGINSLFAKMFYYIAVALMFSLCYLIFPGKFFFRGHQFPALGMGLHAVSFSVNAIALAGLMYYQYSVTTTLTKWMALIGVSAGAWVTLTFSIHTINALFSGFIFRPELKWGPFSAFNRLMHESFRGISKKLHVLIENPGPEFKQLWKEFELLHHTHADQEDNFLFPLISEFAPNHPQHAQDEHEEHHKQFENINAMIESGDYTSMVEPIKEFLADMETHMVWEEKNLQPIGRKYIPLDKQTEVINKIWASVPGETWKILIPVLLNNMPYHAMRIRWLKAVCWAMPERAQQIGYYLYKGVSDTMWISISTDMPEIIPRLCEGPDQSRWVRYY
eukprot:Pgem_evm1s7856